MNIQDFINNFNFTKPDWSNVPDGLLNSDLDGLTGNQVSKFNSIKTLWELSQPPQPESRSRVWKSTNGYIHLVSWSNASLLRVLGVKWVRYLKEIKGNYRNLEEVMGRKINQVSSSKFLQHPLNSSNSFGWKYLDRLEGQFLDALRSTIANQEEGFSRPTTSEYLNFLGYAQASLKEVKGDIQRSGQDGLLTSKSGSSLVGIGIDLKTWHEVLKKSVISRPVKGNYRSLEETRGKRVEPVPLAIHSSSKFLQNPLNSFNFGYKPVDNLNSATLTYEIFIELANKTDWHLRKLVESLENKLNQEEKYYLVEKARLRQKASTR